jgi:peptide/nickel transport system substrate-binding protein
MAYFSISFATKYKLKNTLLASLLILTIIGSYMVPSLVAQEETINRDETLVYTDEMGSATIPMRNFNPYSPDVQSVWFTGIFETLYIFDSVKFGLMPWIADGQPTWIDPYTLEVKLKKDVYWQDNVPLTAEDVLYSYELPKRYPETGGIALSMWPYLVDVKIVDPYTLQFNVNKSIPSKIQIYSVLCYAWIVPKHIFEKAEKNYTSITEFLFEEPIGSGPYKLLKWESTKITKIRWDEWWGTKYFGLPEPKYLIFVPSTGNEETDKMIMVADVDACPAISPGWGDLRNYGVGFWFDHPPWTNPVQSVRINMFLFNNKRLEERFGKYAIFIKYALAYAINRSALAERAAFGLGVPLNDPTGILPESPLAFLRDENVVKNYTFTYDPIKAKKILDDAGIVDKDKDGIREAPNGEKLTLDAVDVEGWTDWEALTELLKSYAAQIGIDIEVYHLDYSVWESRVRAGDYDVMPYGSSIWSPLGYWSFLSLFDYRYPQWPLVNGTPAWYYNNEICKLDDEIAEYPDPFDPEAQPVLKNLVGKAQEILARDMPAVLVYVWGYEYGYQTKYWTGWASESNPYPYSEQGDPGFLNVLVHLKSTKYVSPTTVTPIPTEVSTLISTLNTTTTITLSRVSRIEDAVAELRSLLITLNILVLVLIIAVAYLIFAQRRFKSS